MRRPFGVILLTTTFLAACTMEDEAPELGAAEQQVGGDGDFMQGDFMQGTGLGDFMQGDFMQGSSDAVWGFRKTDWMNSGFKLKNAGMYKGHLVAAWDKAPACIGGLNNSIGRTCDWHTPGSASCIPNTSVTVRAGGCAANPAQRSIIRVCSGRKPCAQPSAIASVDALCSGTTNPAVTFTCPSSGRYFVMVGPKNAGFGTQASSFTFTMQTTPNAIFATALSGVDFNGTTLNGEHDSGLIKYKITADPQVFTGDTQGTTSFYTLHQDNAEAHPLCRGTDNRAIPLAGRWFSDGTHDPGVTTTFTLGCTTGVIAKCYMHGYFPWATRNGVSLRDYHQTCTRAARADFCGVGEPHTVNGTTIDLYDRIGRVTANPNNVDPVMEIEAIWVREPMGETAAGMPAACLSKKRWDTIPYDAAGRCPNIEDPRLYTGEFPPNYCEDVSVSTWWLRSPDNLIATESSFYDAGLWRWRKGGDHRSTTLCTTTEDESECTDDGYQLDPAPVGGQPVLLGSVYHVDLDPSLRPAATIPLYTFRNPTTGDYLTTTDESYANYGERRLEGYIRDLSCEATDTCIGVPLELWAGNGEWVTTTPDKHPGGGFFKVRTLGYLPR